MLVAGFDFSTHAVDAVLLPLDSDEAVWQRIPLQGADVLERCRSLRDRMPSRSSWNDSGVVAIGLERPAGASRLAVAELMQIRGALIACLPMEPVLTEYAPAAWKRLSVGKGNASKEDVGEWTLGIWPQRYAVSGRTGEGGLTFYPPQDALDAFCIAWATRSQLVVEEAA